jgi:hypothetical protein
LNGGRGKGHAKNEQNQQLHVCKTSKSIVWHDRRCDFALECRVHVDIGLKGGKARAEKLSPARVGSIVYFVWVETEGLGSGPFNQLATVMKVNGKHEQAFPIPFNIDQAVFVRESSDHLDNAAQRNCHGKTMAIMVHDRQGRGLKTISISCHRASIRKRCRESLCFWITQDYSTSGNPSMLELDLFP